MKLISTHSKRGLFKQYFILIWAIFLCAFSFAQSRCNTWLNLPGNGSYLDMGSVPIYGQKLTVECVFNRTTPYDPISNGGELVSNHCSPADVNYLLRPNFAAITTSNGFFSVQTDGILLNTTYHVAMVYDGSTLKLYRNGILLAQTTATGNLKTNSLTTKIGRTACLASTYPTEFVGYINEIRIWDIDKSQSQIQQNMSGVLLNPQILAGLKRYFTFNSLYDKVTSSHPASTIGLAVINATNPNQNIVICDVDRSPVTPLDNNTFLYVSVAKSGVNLGDLKISGNKLTIEATITRTQEYDPAFFGGDIVSKHCTPSNVNYLLRPNQAAITTTNGYFHVDASCPVELWKTYHVAMIYDGAHLKLYRNGRIIGSVPATGNLVDNTYSTKIGITACTENKYPQAAFLGFVDEVRIWNTARLTTDLQKYSRTRLDNPGQLGLKAYYIFSSLVNRQGNSTYNGKIIGSAAINQTNTASEYYGIQSGCVDASDARVFIDLNTLLQKEKVISNNESYNDIRPNPAKDYIKITSSCNNCPASIVNSLGVIVKSFKMRNGVNDIYIGNLKKGIYFLKKNENGNTITKKIIKL